MKVLCFRIVLLLIFSVTAQTSFSQYYYYNDKWYDRDLIWEIGGSFGGMYSITDVGKKQFNAFLPSRLDYKSTKANGGIYAGLLYRDLIGARLEINIGSVSAGDSTGSLNRQFHNLSYRSKITELALVTEVHPLTLTNWEQLPAISPYIIAGLGWFKFNPKAKYKDKWVELQPLGTAGQGLPEFPELQPYKLSSVCIPFGIGFKYDITPKIAARFEIVERFTFTDYLDDASAKFIDPDLFYKYYTPEKAEMVKTLGNRYLEKYPNKKLIGAVRGGTATTDKYLTINLKLAIMFGRERIM
jgi:hypothetical protein